MTSTKEVELIVRANELSLVEDNALNKDQLQHLLKKTPDKYVKERPAKGGGKWKYVTGGYVKKVLNLMFGWDWDFEIIEDKILFGEVIVKGRLTCRSAGKTIVKMQYGNKEVIFKTEKWNDPADNHKEKKRSTDQPLSIGNDLKAAATDCLKKCAAEIGIAADIYNAEEFRVVTIEEENPKLVKEINAEIKEQFDLMTSQDEVDRYFNGLPHEEKTNKSVIQYARILRESLKPKV